MREHDSILGRLEETFARASAWIAGRRQGGGHAGQRRLAALRAELAAARRSLRETGRADLARVRATLDDLKSDYDVPPPATAFTRAELDAFRRHLHTTAGLVRDLSNLDSPTWNRSYEEYERSWDDLERARSAGEREPASP